GSSIDGTVIAPTSGVGFTITANTVAIRDLRITGTGSTRGVLIDSAVAGPALENVAATDHQYALHLGASANVTDMELTEVSFTDNAVGFEVAPTGKVDGLVVTSSHFDDNSLGWNI